MYERLTDRARKVMHLAEREAHRFCHSSIGTEHILLGLVEAGCGVGTTALATLSVDLVRVRCEVARCLQEGPVASCGKLPQTPQTQKAFEHAMDEARAICREHNRDYYVGSEHLLLGLMHVDDGVACQVLTGLGISRDQLRDEIIKLLTAGWKDAGP